MRNDALLRPSFETRAFSVRVHGANHARIVEEPSFEAAAIAYLEDCALADEHEVSVIVRDLTDGREHCFCVDVDSGDVAPCE